MSHHVSNRSNLERITANIPWHPYELINRIQAGDWIGKPDPSSSTFPDWVYYVLKPLQDIARAIEFKRITPNGFIQATTHSVFTLATKGYRPVRILSQEKHGSTLKVARDASTPGKNLLTYWIFELGFIQELPWDLGEWHWQAISPLGDAPFFGYIAKRGYKNAQKLTRALSILTFI
jgi:hypothetical protein